MKASLHNLLIFGTAPRQIPINLHRETKFYKADNLRWKAGFGSSTA